ncbi:hypothetical protein APT59_11080 [Pseudomonas oryzihabitans]|uniref:Ig-like domain-containing protein n=1 Tax=Pseudomonas oryzihabitans TaxID=47885 RepID=A0A0U4W4I1_9PSED|nr:phage tail protein [Pseudomonas oryzihabitans]ALZ84710.1 hypothetical protein APT59_11080 [Pseudomonas oryzihabitans]
MSQTYYAILTAIGEAKLANAAALNTTLKLAKMAVGDGGGVVPTPNRSQTALVGEWYRAGLNTLAVDPNNTSQIIAELVIPEATGGSWIREMGLIDADGNLIAVANTPPSYKPQLAEGSGRTQVLRMVLVVSSTSAVELKIDPSVVLATRQYVDDAITVAVNRLDNKQSVRVATTANLALSGTPTVDGIALAVGDRILVKNQDTASQNGLYLVAAGTWNRALDADASSEVTPGLTVYVEQGTAQADTIWKLVTDAPITLGTTALSFTDITSGYAPLRSPAFTDKPTAPLPSQFDSSNLLATTEHIRRAALHYRALPSLSAATALTLDHLGALILAGAATTFTLTLPAISLARYPKAQGAALCIAATTAAGVTIAAPGEVAITTASGESIASLTLGQNDTAEFVFLNEGEWRLVGGSVADGYANTLLRRTRSIMASITSGGTPAANQAFRWTKTYPAFRAPCDGMVLAVSHLNMGNTPQASISNVAKITGSTSGSFSTGDSTPLPMSDIAGVAVVRGETVTVSCEASGSATSVTWPSLTHNTAYWFIPSNNLAL